MLNMTDLLIGTRLSTYARTLNLICLHFESGDGTIYCLHSQCLLRIMKDKSLIASSNDVYNPCTAFNGDIDEWDWSEQVGETLYDEGMKNGLSEALPLRVLSVSFGKCGDIFLELEQGYSIEIIVTTVTDDESWRFFQMLHSEEITFVYSGDESYSIGISNPLKPVTVPDIAERSTGLAHRT